MQLVWIALIDLPALLLIFWLLRCMSAARMTTRYILAPLLIVIAGIALEQPAITTRMVVGTILMAVGAIGLLLAPDDDTHETISALPERANALSLRLVRFHSQKV